MDLFKLLGTVAIDTVDAIRKLREAQQEGQKTESKLGKFFSGIGKGAAVMGKAIGAGMVATGTAVAGLVGASVKAYADYEQLVGGVDTLFKDSSNKVQEYAKNAYKTAGMSANAYMETVTSFSASLLQSLDGDTAAAAEKADMAITDMSDNANKMGTDITMIQNAYQGFAKQNYTMLDNLKLGYGGTKEEMQRLLDDAQKISGIKYDISSYADVVDAIHVMQEEMGIAGTTAKEASSTISGSLSSMKGAWSNLLTAISADDLPFDDYVNAFVDSVSTVAENLLPRIQIALEGVVQLIDQLAPIIIGKIPELLSSLLPSIVSAATGLMNSLVAAFPGIVSALMDVLPMLIEGVMSIVDALIGALPQILQAIVIALPTLIPQLIDAVVGLIMMLVEMLPQIIQPIIDSLPTIIISIVEALTGNLPALIQGIIQLILGIVTAIPQIIQALVDAIPTIISLLVEAILNNLPAIIMGLIQVVIGIVKALPQILASLISAVPKALSGIWDGIKNVFSNLGSWFSEKFSGAKDAAVNAWNNAKEKFGKVWDNVKGAFANVGNWFKDKFKEGQENAKQAWSKAKETFGKVWNNIQGAFSKVGSWFKEKFSDAKKNAEKAWSGAKQAWTNISNKVSEGFSGLGDKLKNLFSQALNKAKEGFSKAFEVGKDLVKGIWNGINNAKDWVLGKIKGFGKSILNGLKSFFGIKSPSRVMKDQVGKFLAEGVAAGIDENAHVAGKSAEDLAKLVLESAEKKLDEYQTYNQMTLADEIAFWDGIRQQCAEGTDARLNADKKYFDAKASLNEQIIEAETTLQEALAEIYQKIEDRTTEIMGSFSMFEQFQADEAVSGKQMIKNLEEQNIALQNWEFELKKLEHRIGGTKLFEYLSSLGVKGLNQVREIASMTQKELFELANMYGMQYELSKGVASSELADETLAETQKAYQEFATTCGELGVEVSTVSVGMSESVNTSFTTIATTVGEKMQSAVSSVTDSLQKIKDAFENFTAHMKMPHITVSGNFSVNPPSAPSFGVEWYKKAMDTPMLMNEPTIFGYNSASGKFMGGGEAGSEVVSGTNTLMNMIQNAVSEQNNNLVYYMQKIIDVLSSYFPQFIDAFNVSLNVDGYELASAMAVPMDQALGKLSSRKDRGR